MEVDEFPVGETDGDVDICAIISISGELECDLMVPLYIKPLERAGARVVTQQFIIKYYICSFS